MRYVKIQRREEEFVSSTFVAPREATPDIVALELNDIDFLDVGTQIILTIVEMSDEDFNKIPDA